MFWKIKKMLVSSTNIKKYRAKIKERSKQDFCLDRSLFFNCIRRDCRSMNFRFTSVSFIHHESVHLSVCSF
ncbi:hypothetical protein DVW91_05585 [Enterococcus faecium]|nr:hypothetical protein DVW91_05585 [Enterococcus faecium]